MTLNPSPERTSLRELASLFLKLGTISFGGPAAHIAMMEDEVVKRRGWISHEYFLDLLGATNIIPGPNSTEMAIHIGYVRGGWKGLTIAGVCFILPAVVISLLLAWLYSIYGTLPQVGHFFWGVRAAVIAIILAAIFRLGRPMIAKKFILIVGAAVFALNLARVDEILLLAVAGIVGLLWGNRDKLQRRVLPFLLFLIIPISASGITAAGSFPPSQEPGIVSLGFFFLKIGSILYGSGYVLVAFLQAGLVDARHWLTQTQLLDAIAVGQFTPGPVLSTATFIGFLILGIPGALVSTAGIFFPSFILVLVTARYVPRLRKSPSAAGFLDGVNAASLGLMLSVCVTLGSSALNGVGSWVIFLAAVIAVVRWNVHAGWIVAGSLLVSWAISYLGIIS